MESMPSIFNFSFCEIRYSGLSPEMMSVVSCIFDWRGKRVLSGEVDGKTLHCRACLYLVVCRYICYSKIVYLGFPEISEA